MLGKKFLKKFIMLLAMCLAFVMLTNFSSSGLRFSNAEKIVTAYAFEDDGADPDTEDNRYAKLLPLVFPEGESELKTFDNGDVTFSGTCDIFESMQIGPIEAFTVSCSFRQIDDDNMWFTVEQDSPYLYNNFETDALVDEVNGCLYSAINVEDKTLYTSSYRDDSSFSDLLQGIVDGNLSNVYGFEETVCMTSDTMTQSTTINENIGVLNQDYNASPRSVSGWGVFAFIVAVVIVTYVIVCQTAEQIKAGDNQKYNYNLEHDENLNNNISSDVYIMNQKSALVNQYKFGFTTFGGVGCEVAAVYNLMITLGEPKSLSEVIHDFETCAIEYSVGWGNLGSNPRQIYKCLKKYGVPYKKYTSLNKFRNAVADTERVNYIYSTWNESISDGLHTFYINKTGDIYVGYNAVYTGDDDNDTDGNIYTTNFNSFQNDKGNFIIGYIILR